MWTEGEIMSYGLNYDTEIFGKCQQEISTL